MPKESSLSIEIFDSYKFDSIVFLLDNAPFDLDFFTGSPAIPGTPTGTIRLFGGAQ